MHVENGRGECEEVRTGDDDDDDDDAQKPPVEVREIRNDEEGVDVVARRKTLRRSTDGALMTYALASLVSE